MDGNDRPVGAGWLERQLAELENVRTIADLWGDDE